MKTYTNIDLFNAICISLFDELYSSFPKEKDINIKSITRSIYRDDIDISFNEAFEYSSYGEDVISFLKEEGFIKSAGTMQSTSDELQVRLTLKGLTILGAIPSSISGEKQESIINRIKNVVNNGIEEAGKDVTQSIVMDVFKASLGMFQAIAF